MVGVGRDFCESSSPTPLLKKVQLEQAAQDRVQVGLEYLQRRRLHNASRQPVPVLHYPQSEGILPHVLCFSLCLLPLVCLYTTIDYI